MSVNNPFVGLDRVDWSALSHAYGPATDVPDMLRALLNEDDEAREQAWDDFWNSVYHQGSVYSATTAVVPFLIALLNAPAVLSRSNIWSMLHSLVNGTYRLEGTLAIQDDITIEIRRAVLEGLPLFLDHAKNGVFEERSLAWQLLGELQERAIDLDLYFRTRFEQEATDDLKGQVLLAHAHLLAPLADALSDRYLDLLNSLQTVAAGTEPLILRVMSLRALAVLAPQQIPVLAVPLLLNYVRQLAGRPGDGFRSDLYEIRTVLDGQPELKRSFLEGALQHPDADLRRHFINDIYSFAQEFRPERAWAVEVLLAHLNVETDPQNRSAALRSLGSLGEAATVGQHNVQAALHELDFDVRLAAAVVIAKQADTAALPTLMQALRSNDLKAVSTAGWALRSFPCLPDDVTATVLDTLARLRKGSNWNEPTDSWGGSSHHSVWANTLRLADHLSTRAEAVEDELILVVQEIDPEAWDAQHVATEQLGRRRVQRAVPVLLQALTRVPDNDPDWYARILQALTATGDRTVVAEVVRLWPPEMHDAHLQRVQIAFLDLLAALGGPEWLPVLDSFRPVFDVVPAQLALLRWKWRGEQADEWPGVLDAAMSSGRWEPLTLALPHIQPHGPDARKVAPLLLKLSRDAGFGPDWNQLEAAQTLHQLTGDGNALEEVAGRMQGFVRSKFGFERLAKLPVEVLGFFRADLETIATSERMQTGWWGADTVAEDEDMQQRARELLKTLEV